MTCDLCGIEHPTNLERLACIEIAGDAETRRLTADDRRRLNRDPDEAWLAALVAAWQRRDNVA